MSADSVEPHARPPQGNQLVARVIVTGVESISLGIAILSFGFLPQNL